MLTDWLYSSIIQLFDSKKKIVALTNKTDVKFSISDFGFPHFYLSNVFFFFLTFRFPERKWIYLIAIKYFTYTCPLAIFTRSIRKGEKEKLCVISIYMLFFFLSYRRILKVLFTFCWNEIYSKMFYFYLFCLRWWRS